MSGNGQPVQFKKATKQAARLRLALIGPPGSGKTYSGLALATSLGRRVAVIDTEKGSASKYADLFAFEVLELSDDFHPRRYVEAIQAAAAAGFDALLIDSLSHAWIGKGGGLELHDRAVDRQKVKNSYTAWGEVTPHHLALMEAIVQSPLHVIATMRSKVEYVQEKDDRTGKTNVRKVGTAPMMRDGAEYEFDVVGDLDQDNTLVITKTRCPALSGAAIRKPGAELAKTLAGWLAGAAAEVNPTTPKPIAAPPKSDAKPADQPQTLQQAMSADTSPHCSPQQIDALSALADELKLTKEQRWDIIRPYKVRKIADLTAEQADAALLTLRRSLAEVLLSELNVNLDDVRLRAPIVKADLPAELTADEATAAVSVLRNMAREAAVGAGITEAG